VNLHGRRRFEDLIAWQKARALNAAVFELTGRAGFARHPELRSQLRRAALSVMANIAEGWERTGIGELRHALSIAKGSAGEVRALLYAAEDLGASDLRTADLLRQQAEEVSRIIAGLMTASRPQPRSANEGR
jgi:four helix bundle protein